MKLDAVSKLVIVFVLLTMITAIAFKVGYDLGLDNGIAYEASR